MNTYRFEVEVKAETRENAHHVMMERLSHDADYGFPYEVGRLLSDGEPEASDRTDRLTQEYREVWLAAESEVGALREKLGESGNRPTLEGLLADPHEQFDPNGEVTALWLNLDGSTTPVKDIPTGTATASPRPTPDDKHIGYVP